MSYYYAQSTNNKVYKIIKQFLKDDTNWYLLRYQLIKRIHSQELKVKSEIPKSQQYFAYLLKLNLSEFEFNLLLKKKSNNSLPNLCAIDISPYLNLLYSIGENPSSEAFTIE